MDAAPRSAIVTLLFSAFLVGCGDSGPASSSAARTESTQSAKSGAAPTTAEAYKYDAYGPRQYSVFNGVNRDNVYRAATGPTTGPVDDSVLLPADDN